MPAIVIIKLFKFHINKKLSELYNITGKLSCYHLAILQL